MKAYLTLSALALSSLLAAQTTYSVLPAGFEKIQDTNYDASYLGRGGKNYNGTISYVPMHIQTGYALGDLGTPVLKAKSLSYRRNNFYGNRMYKSTQTVAIYMSHSPLDTTAYTTTFAKNEGTRRTQVFGSAGKPAILNWPAAPYVNNGQKPVPFSLKIPLSAPYVIISTGAKSLCIDFTITKRVSTYQSGANTRNANLFLDAAGLARGLRITNGPYQSKCKFSNGRWSSSLGYTLSGLTTNGGPWFVRYGNVPANAVGAGTISGMGVKTKPNPFKLPIDLKVLGAPGCWWNVGLETGFWVALKASASGQMKWPTLTIPAGLPVSSFFDQGLVLDAKANNFGFVPTWSSEWKIVKAITPKCVTVYKHQDTTPPAATGTLRAVFAPIIRLDV
jgi:hypothetical protein